MGPGVEREQENGHESTSRSAQRGYGHLSRPRQLQHNLSRSGYGSHVMKALGVGLLMPWLARATLQRLKADLYYSAIFATHADGHLRRKPSADNNYSTDGLSGQLPLV